MAGIVITGASSGLGLMLAERMYQIGWGVFGLSLHPPTNSNSGIVHIPCDVGDSEDVNQAAAQLAGNGIRVLVNCAAINRINYLEDVLSGEWDEVMFTNAKAIYNTARAFLPPLKLRKGTILNIVSDAAHRPMTGSLAYNASKGAAHIMTLQLARELTRRHGICVFGVSPGKLGNTGMSQYINERVCELRGWTPEEADRYARSGRLWPEEIDVNVLADFLVYLLREPIRHRYFSGCVIPYGA